MIRKDWAGAEVEIKCRGWSGRLNTSLRKGGAGRPGRRSSFIRGSSSGTAESEPLESCLKLSFSGGSKGHMHNQGEAYSRFSIDTQLSLAFGIDQTHLKSIIDALVAADSEWKVAS
jgi:hypothetical protein